MTLLMTQNREKHSVISHFSFGCHGNRFHVKSDKVPLFNSENLRKTAGFEAPPSIVSGVVHKTIYM